MREINIALHAFALEDPDRFYPASTGRLRGVYGDDDAPTPPPSASASPTQRPGLLAQTFNVLASSTLLACRECAYPPRPPVPSDGADPSAPPPVEPLDTTGSWLQLLVAQGHLPEDTLENADLTRCPEDNSPQWDNNDRFTTYGLNGYFARNNDPYRGIRFNQVRNSSEVVLLGEMAIDRAQDHFMPVAWGEQVWRDDVDRGWIDNLRYYGEVDDDGAPAVIATEIHNGKSHWAFADGHVKAATLDELWQQSGADEPTVDAFDPLR
ncbi:MAG: H-X9-DG-CTERM domain-containing protein [Planctomycetota bacterium]